METSSAFQHALGAELALDYRVAGPLGLRAAFVHTQRNGDGTLTARIPHPLYLGRPREAQQTVGGLSEGVNGLHFGLSWRKAAGSIGLTLMAGGSALSVRADAPQDDPLRYTQVYPFDTITLEPATLRRVSRGIFGYHAGGALDVRLSARLGLAAQARYVRARSSVGGSSGSIALDGGGLDLGLGLRFSR